MEYSVVIPLKNEEDNVLPLIQELEPVMERLGKPWELLCIDDGSTDQTLPLLHSLKDKKDYLRILSFTKNFGQSSAFDAGFKHAKGRFVITLDGDLQNDPHDIPKLLKEMDGCDLACGRRAKRNDPFSKRIVSFFANRIRSRLLGDGVLDTGCSLKIFRLECLQQIKMYQGMHRFLPALFVIEGYRVKEVHCNHRKRTKGQTKYNFFNRSFNTIADLLAVRWMRKRRLHYTLKGP